MKLKKLTLENFKGLSGSWGFGSYTTISGQNGAGKTTLLEALTILTTGSCPSLGDKNAGWAKRVRSMGAAGQFKLTAEIEHAGETHSPSFTCGPNIVEHEQVPVPRVNIGLADEFLASTGPARIRQVLEAANLDEFEDEARPFLDGLNLPDSPLYDRVEAGLQTLISMGKSLADQQKRAPIEPIEPTPTRTDIERAESDLGESRAQERQANKFVGWLKAVRDHERAFANSKDPEEIERWKARHTQLNKSLSAIAQDNQRLGIEKNKLLNARSAEQAALGGAACESCGQSLPPDQAASDAVLESYAPRFAALDQEITNNLSEQREHETEIVRLQVQLEGQAALDKLVLNERPAPPDIADEIRVRVESAEDPEMALSLFESEVEQSELALNQMRATAREWETFTAFSRSYEEGARTLDDLRKRAKGLRAFQKRLADQVFGQLLRRGQELLPNDYELAWQSGDIHLVRERTVVPYAQMSGAERQRARLAITLGLQADSRLAVIDELAIMDPLAIERHSEAAQQLLSDGLLDQVIVVMPTADPLTVNPSTEQNE